MIRANAHSDDHRYSVEFDATPYFEQASGKEIQKLAACGFRGDYPSDAVAQFIADAELDAQSLAWQKHKHKIEDSPLNQMFAYIDLIPAGDDQRGFECSVNEDDVWAWLRGNS